jgi:hypothetical protein
MFVAARALNEFLSPFSARRAGARRVITLLCFRRLQIDFFPKHHLSICIIKLLSGSQCFEGYQPYVGFVHGGPPATEKVMGFSVLEGYEAWKMSFLLRFHFLFSNLMLHSHKIALYNSKEITFLSTRYIFMFP